MLNTKQKRNDLKNKLMQIAEGKKISLTKTEAEDLVDLLILVDDTYKSLMFTLIGKEPK